MRVARLLIAFGFLASPCSAPAEDTEPTWNDAQRKHWSFVAPRRPAVPLVKKNDLVRNPIDAFVLSGLERFELAPAVEADRATLIRRLRFDLTGLPPSPDEVDGFLGDARPDAYERLVDRLLATPQYAERWARPWLDLARFAESDGFKSDVTRPNAWRFRDWVVRALDADMPYDRFVRLQLAGDELEPENGEAFIATGFNRNFPFEDNNKVPGLNRQLMLEDMTDTTASVFLGLTVACARCHDHKYDPISQKDYYRFQALFAASTPRDDHQLADAFTQAVEEFVAKAHKDRVASARRAIDTIEKPYLAPLIQERLAKLPAEVRKAFETDPEARSAFQEDLLLKHANSMTVPATVMKAAMNPDDRRLWEDRRERMASLAKEAPKALPTASGMTDAGPKAPPVHLLMKGNFTRPAEEVPPGFLSVLGPTRIDPAASSPVRTTGRRAALAEWLTRADHPLTARVMVNRLWLGHFGRGLVATPSDFGTQGAEPSHPELLDWLSTEFVARGWSLKAMHRLMVTSSTYRQSSLASPEVLKADPDNLLLSRMSRRRLEAEAVRDALLAVVGKLDTRVGGPSVFPDLPPGIQTRGGWTRSKSAADRNRRSLYVFVRRNLKYPLFEAFDSPDTNTTCADRNISVNAPQALMLLNSDLILSYSRDFAARVSASVASPGDLTQMVTQAYRMAFGRMPDPSEIERGVAFLGRSTVPAGEDGASEKPDSTLVDYCHALLNLNEFVFVE